MRKVEKFDGTLIYLIINMTSKKNLPVSACFNVSSELAPVRSAAIKLIEGKNIR
jgi:hypothetical protein